MKRNFLFLILSIFIVNLYASEVKEAEGISYYKAGFPQVAKPLLIAEYTTDPSTKSETCFYLGNIYFGENKPDSAQIYFKKGLVGNEVDVLNTIGLAMIKIKTDPKSADLEIQNALKLKNSKKNPDYFIAAANAYLFNGLIDQAIIYLDKAKEIKPKYASTAVLSGDIELAKKNVGNACSNYELAILYDPNCKEAYVKYARAYKNVNTPLAIEKLNELKQKDPTFLLVDKELADIYYANNDFDNAAKLYASYLKSGNSNVQDFTKYAMTLFLNKDYTNSLQVAQMGLQKDPRNPAFNRMAMYNNVALGKYDDAIKYADLFFNKSDNPDISYYDYTYYGQALRQTKQYDLAIVQFKKALKLDSTQVGFWKDISDMYGEKLDYKNAISSYNNYLNSIDKSKINVDMIYDLGKLYYDLGNSQTDSANVKKVALIKADSMFAKVVSMDSTSYRGYIWRARTNFALDPETKQGIAKPFYEQTLAVVEAKADVRYNPVILECSRFLGYYYFLKSDFTESKIYWNKILSIDPQNELALKAIDGIDKTLKAAKKK
ncbi:MAG: tetratricopeptide repeat protein [Paludibacter sp.]|nr:tetratricopeptide repeat protein [Paludibacter sp.]